MKRVAAWLAAVFVCMPAAATGVEQPRPFAYAVGDLIEQRIHLEADGKRFVPAELPRPGRVGVSLWRREVRQEDDDAGSWLVVQYQIINAPPALAVRELPALRLASSDAALILNTPAWPFSVAPFTRPQAFGVAGLEALRGDLAPRAIALAPFDRRLRELTTVLALLLLSWTGYAWHRHWQRGRRMPFARAVRDMRGMADGSPAAWRRLQHALNDAAGEVVRAGTLDRLIARAPYLAPERAALERYCREASALFFGGALPPDASSVHLLASRLMGMERWHAR